MNLYAEKAKWIISLFLFLYIFYSGIYKTWGVILNDFSNYYVSSQILIHNEDYSILYQDSKFNDEVKKYGITQESKFSQYPPITAIIMIPLTVFDAIQAKNIWMIINVIVLFFCVLLVKNLFLISLTDIIFIFSLTGYSLINNFAFGQFYIVLLFLILLSLYLAEKGYLLLSGLLLGFATIVKILPVILIFWFIINRKWKSVFYSTVSAAVFFIIEWIIFGKEISSQYWFSILPGHLNSDLILQSPYAFSFQSWNSLLLNLFVYNEQFNQFPGYNSISLYFILKYLIYGLVSLSVVINIRTLLKSKKSGNDLLLILFIGSLLLLPASATYHFILLVIPFSILLKSDSFSLREKTAVFLLFFFIGFIPLNRITPLHLTGFSTILHFPRLICLTFIFIILTTQYWKANTSEI